MTTALFHVTPVHACALLSVEQILSSSLRSYTLHCKQSWDQYLPLKSEAYLRLTFLLSVAMDTYDIDCIKQFVVVL